MAVKIRLKRLGRTHRPYYRICVMDGRSPRDGKAIEEVGTYDPMIPELDKSVTMLTMPPLAAVAVLPPGVVAVPTEERDVASVPAVEPFGIPLTMPLASVVVFVVPVVVVPGMFATEFARSPALWTAVIPPRRGSPAAATALAPAWLASPARTTGSLKNGSLLRVATFD